MPTVLITKNCPVCTRIVEVEVDEHKFREWRSGIHIQHVFPEKTSMERETLISGVCSQKCWDELWGEEDGN